MDRLTIILICIIVFCLCMALYKVVDKADKKLKKKVVQQQVEAKFSPEQLKFLRTVGSAYNKNEVKSRMELLEECGIAHDVVYSHNSALIEEHIPFIKNQDDYNVFTTYLSTVAKRHDLAFRPIIPLSGATLGVNLHKNEGIYQAIYGVVLYQEKTTVTNIAYNGCVWRSGPLRAGNLSVISNEITRFAPMDAGKIFITNERIIFIGKQKNVTKQIKIDDVLSYNLYQDGILVNIPNKKPLLFKFQEIKDFEIYEISDQLNQFILTMNRMMAGNYNEDLIAPTTEVDAPVSKNIEEALLAKNYATDIIKILDYAKKGEPFRTSDVQRKLEVGYNRAGLLTDQLEVLKFITPFQNGKREWLVSASDTDILLKLIDAASPYILG